MTGSLPQLAGPPSRPEKALNDSLEEAITKHIWGGGCKGRTCPQTRRSCQAIRRAGRRNGVVSSFGPEERDRQSSPLRIGFGMCLLGTLGVNSILLCFFEGRCGTDGGIEGDEASLSDLVRSAAVRRGEVHQSYVLGTRLLVLCTRTVPEKSFVLDRPRPLSPGHRRPLRVFERASRRLSLGAPGCFALMLVCGWVRGMRGLRLGNLLSGLVC